MLRTALPNLTVKDVLEVGYLAFSKIESFVIVMTSLIFLFVADNPGTYKLLIFIMLK